MSAILCTAAAGQGKTQAAIDHIREFKLNHRFSRVWVLLPTDLQINAFRARLTDATGQNFGIEFFNFYELYTRLLDIAGIPQRRVANGARFRILHHVIDHVEDELEHFKVIAHSSGFIVVLQRWIDELKQARVAPEQYSSVADSAKDRDLARIYEAYQNHLRSNNLADQEGEGWLALATLEENPDIDLKTDLLVIDGYDQFTMTQAHLLSRLANKIPNTLLTLTYESERAETAHRRFAQTRIQLIETGSWEEVTLTAQRPQDRARVLAHLSDQLFSTAPAIIHPDESLTMIEAPDRRREVQAVLRRVKALLLDHIPPEQIMIVARDVTPYLPYFLETTAAYGIPFATRRGLNLTENPAVAAWLSLIQLADQGFPRRATMDTLRSPYLVCPDLTPEQIDALDKISRSQHVVRGRQDWLDAITASGQAPEVTDEEVEDIFRLPPEDAAKLRTDVDTFFNRITLPAEATAREYARRLEALIGSDPSAKDDEEEIPPAPVKHFQILKQIRAKSEKAIQTRDLIAIDCLKRVIADVLAAYELVDARAELSWETFRFDILSAIDQMTSSPTMGSNRLGKVLLANIYEARGLSHDYIFMLGLSEGEFPAPTPEDALYTDEERIQIQQEGLPLLTRAQDNDESTLFYEMTALAQKRLTLTRAYIDDKGNEWPASPYWRAALSVVPTPIHHLRLASNYGFESAAQLSEALVAQADSLNQDLTLEAAGIHNWLLTAYPRQWQNTLLGRWVEARRLSSRAPHDDYTGRLSDRHLIKRVEKLLGPGRVWSASQFNEYGICPYRFFARRLLRLETVEELEEGMTILQLGTLLHEILEHTYRKIGDAQLAIAPENQARAVLILDETLDHLLPNAPRRHGFRATHLWKQEQARLRARLRALIMLDFSQDSPVNKDLPGQRYTYGQEIQFGDSEHPVVIDGAAGPLKVRGKIDRVDVSDGQAVVLDYKSGSSPFSAKDMLEGRNVQMMLYTIAAQQVLDDVTPISGMFWHIGTRKTSGQIDANTEDIDTAIADLHARILEGREGIFVNVPSKPTFHQHENKCVKHCEFNRLCRVNAVSRRKG